MPATFLESERLWFRAPQKSDAPLFTQYLQDPRVSRNLLIGRYPFNEEGELKWLERQAEPPTPDGKTDVVLAFGLKGEEQPLGTSGFHKISMIHRHAEWGIFIGRPDQWGKGIGREVAVATLRYGFDTLNLNRIFLRVNADNERGVRSYTAAGFKHEGTMRGHTFVEGKYTDLHIMGVLRDEWHRH